MVAAALIIICAGLISWYLFFATAEYLQDLIQGYASATSLTIIFIVLLIDYFWIRILVFLLREYVFTYFPSWCIWCSG